MLYKLPQKTSGTIIIEDSNIDQTQKIVITLLHDLFFPSLNPQLKKNNNTLKDFIKCPDFYYVSTKLTDKSSIPIEHIREIISKLQYSSIQNTYKCLYIENGKHLSIESQNTLLKTLEEPPANTFIIIAIEDKNVLLPTILSRSLIFSSSTSINNNDNGNYTLPSNIQEAFDEAEKISKISDPKRKKEKALTFFEALIEKANKLPEDQKYLSLKKLLYFRKAISKNANLRLVLENGIIEIYS